MHFADFVLARELVNRLDENQIRLILDALEGDPICLGARDRAAIEAFVLAVRYEMGPTSAEAEIDAVFAISANQRLVCT